MDDVVERVGVTPAAAQLLRMLRVDHGPLMFHQSGGCCDGSAPMCYPAGDLIVGASDMFLGALEISTSVDRFEPVPVYISAPQFRYWSHTHLTIDLIDGRGAGFSLEAPTGQRFVIRSRRCSRTRRRPGWRQARTTRPPPAETGPRPATTGGSSGSSTAKGRVAAARDDHTQPCGDGPQQGSHPTMARPEPVRGRVASGHAKVAVATAAQLTVPVAARPVFDEIRPSLLPFAKHT